MGGRILGKKLSSFQIIIAGFLAVILMGTLLLSLPIASKTGAGAPFGDAFFTSVSAVCVTGLVVRDTALGWSVFGQAVILLLIQIGGLGIFLVKKKMDDVIYEYKDGQNVLTLVKKLS